MMKKILVMAFAAMLLVLVGASAQATYWVPTLSGDDDVNYVSFTGGGTFAIFDNDFIFDATSFGATASSGNYLSLVPTLGFETIYFSQVSSDWELRYDPSSSSADFTLTGDNTFQLAWCPFEIPTGATSDVWYLNTGYVGNDGVYSVLWGNPAPGSSSIIQIDAVPSAVPIPPSAIMLFSGILGLFGVGRMRRDS